MLLQVRPWPRLPPSLPAYRPTHPHPLTVTVLASFYHSLCRIAALEALKTVTNAKNFAEIEASVISRLLPIVLERLDDKPNVVDAAEAAGLAIVKKLSIQGFLYVASLVSRTAHPSS